MHYSHAVCILRDFWPTVTITGVGFDWQNVKCVYAGQQFIVSGVRV